MLLGEFHGVAENPLIVEAVAGAFEVDALAFESPAGDEQRLLEDTLAWVGDGRVTAGHIAVLRRTRCRVTGVDLGLNEHRDEAMADAIARVPGRVLFVAGNVHTRLTPFHEAPTAGSILATTRPALCTLDVHYRSGRYWNFGPRSFADPSRHRRGRTSRSPPRPRRPCSAARIREVLGRVYDHMEGQKSRERRSPHHSSRPPSETCSRRVPPASSAPDDVSGRVGERRLDFKPAAAGTARGSSAPAGNRSHASMLVGYRLAIGR